MNKDLLVEMNLEYNYFIETRDIPFMDNIISKENIKDLFIRNGIRIDSDYELYHGLFWLGDGNNFVIKANGEMNDILDDCKMVAGLIFNRNQFKHIATAFIFQVYNEATHFYRCVLQRTKNGISTNETYQKFTVKDVSKYLVERDIIDLPSYCTSENITKVRSFKSSQYNCMFTSKPVIFIEREFGVIIKTLSKQSTSRNAKMRLSDEHEVMNQIEANREAEICFEKNGFQGVIPRLYDAIIDSDNNTLLLAMSPLGISINNLTPINDENVKDMINCMDLVLSYVHEKECIHRDIKPDNIVKLQEKKFMLIDWELSLLNIEDPYLWCFVGTIGYSSVDVHKYKLDDNDPLYSYSKLGWALQNDNEYCQITDYESLCYTAEGCQRALPWKYCENNSIIIKLKLRLLKKNKWAKYIKSLFDEPLEVIDP